jgi:hypothetical protein
MIRDLYFYFYLGNNNNENNDFILLHLALLNHYNHLFNGEKIINIAVDDYSVELDGFIKNNKIFEGAIVNKVINTGQESTYFIDTIRNFKKDDGRITFYGHAKAATLMPISTYTTMAHWVHSLYYFNLNENYLPEVENQLKNKFFSGCLQITSACPPWVKSDWHYSGTFYWMNNSKVFNNIEEEKFDALDRYSVEAFPGYTAKVEDSFSTFISENYNFNSYNVDIWQQRLTIDYLGENLYTDYMKHHESFINPIINKKIKLDKVESKFEEKLAICYACSGESYRESALKRLTEDCFDDENIYYYVLTDDKSYFKDVKLNNFLALELKDFYEEFPEIKPYEFLLEAKDKNEYAEKFMSDDSYRYPMSILRFLLLQAYRDGIANIALINTDTKFRLDRFDNSYFKEKNVIYNAVSEWDDYIWNNNMNIIANRLEKKYDLVSDQKVRILDACARLFIFEKLEDTKRFFDIWHDMINYVYENNFMKHFQGWYAKNEEYIIAPIYNVLGLNKRTNQANNYIFDTYNNPNKERFWMTPDESMIRHTNYEEFLRLNNLEDGDVPKIKTSKKENKKILVCQYYTNNLKYGKYSIDINKAYCERHGYDYHVYNDHDRLWERANEPNVEAIQWFKVVFLKEMMEQKPDYDWYLFLDIDAVFCNHKDKIENYIDENYNVIMSDDYSHHSAVNTGVILIKKNDWSLQFLQDWYASRHTTNGKETLELIDWSAGMAAPDNGSIFLTTAFHEQTCVSVMLKKDETLKNKIKILDKSVFNSTSYHHKAFIFHAFCYSIDEYKTLNLLHDAIMTPFDKVKKIKVVYFVFCVGDYLKRAQSDILRMEKSGLYEDLDEMHVVASIPSPELDSTYDDLVNVFKGRDKVKFMKCYGNRFEHYGVTKAWVEANKSDGYIMYFHCKGVVNKPSNSNEHSDWKKQGDSSFIEMLKYYTIDKYKDCLHKLEVYDMVNVSDSYSRGWPSGNFWWSNMSYLRENVYPFETMNDRYFNEAWINIRRPDYSCFQFYNRFSFRDKFTYIPEASYKNPSSLVDKKIILKSAKYMTLLEPENEDDHNRPTSTNEIDFTEKIQKNLDSNNGKGFTNIIVSALILEDGIDDPCIGVKKCLVIEFHIEGDSEIYRLVADDGVVLDYIMDKPVSLGYILHNNEIKNIY